MLTYLFRTHTDPVLLIVRLILGIVFFAHGAQKALGWFKGPGLKNTIKTFREHMGIPPGLALLAIAAEFLGGIALILGLLSRVAALGVAVTMIVGIALVHGRHGLFLNWFGNQEGHGYEYNLLAVALALIVIIRGSGALSLDYFIFTYLH